MAGLEPGLSGIKSNHAASKPMPNYNLVTYIATFSQILSWFV